MLICSLSNPELLFAGKQRLDLSPHHSKQRSRDGFPFFTTKKSNSLPSCLALVVNELQCSPGVIDYTNQT